MSIVNKNTKTIQVFKTNDIVPEILFSMAVILELAVMMTDHFASWTIPYRGRITHVAFALFCVKILMTKYDYMQLAIMTLSGMLGIISYYTCGDEYVIRAVVFVAAAVGVNKIRNLRIVFWGTIVGSVIIILLALCGICGEVVDVRHYGRGMVEARYCLGFNHANNVHCMMWYIITIFLLFRRSISKTGVIICMLGNVILYYFTRSRTGLLLMFITLLGVVCVRYFGKIFNRFVLLILVLIELVAALVMTMYAAIYLAINLPVISFVDKLLTGRLEMVSERAYVQLWRVFPTTAVSSDVDNAFAGITYSYGIIVGIFLVGVIVYCAIRKYRQNDRLSLVMLFSVIGIYFMESTFVLNISLLCNVLLLLLWNYTEDNRMHSDKDESI
ncbi:MAG: hypothetical protein K5868_02485 [Lachnospiraceae bacterium]|nr:hypothetical protein [Lachnospiraceae bacterium]